MRGRPVWLPDSVAAVLASVTSSSTDAPSGSQPGQPGRGRREQPASSRNAASAPQLVLPTAVSTTDMVAWVLTGRLPPPDSSGRGAPSDSSDSDSDGDGHGMAQRPLARLRLWDVPRAQGAAVTKP